MVLFHITLFILMFAIILEIFYLFSFPQLEQLSGVEIDSKIESYDKLIVSPAT